MAIGILPVTSIVGLTAPAGAAAAGGTSPGSAGAFQSVFSEAVKKVESFQTNAEQSVNRFLSGEGEEIHKVALSAEHADLSFQLFVQARNKIVSAYQEVMRMQI